jgi:hypothetical protein
MKDAGEYGGIVLRGFKGDGMSYIAGATLSPELVATWPLSNRIALHQSGNIDWYGPPSAVEETVRQSGSPAPARKSVKLEGADVKAPAAPRRKRQ